MLENYTQARSFVCLLTPLPISSFSTLPFIRYNHPMAILNIEMLSAYAVDCCDWLRFISSRSLLASSSTGLPSLLSCFSLSFRSIYTFFLLICEQNHKIRMRLRRARRMIQIGRERRDSIAWRTHRTGWTCCTLLVSAHFHRSISHATRLRRHW